MEKPYFKKLIYKSLVVVFLVIASVAFMSCGDQSGLSSRENYPEATQDSGMEVAVESGKEDMREMTEGIMHSRKTAITEAVKKASPAIVSITVTEVVEGSPVRFDPFFGFFIAPSQQEFNSMGSGFIISEDGLIVTNEHVVSEHAKKIVVALSDGRTFDADIVGRDAISDLALLQIISGEKNFDYVEFSDSDEVMVGEWAIAMGNPFGLFDAGEPSVTVGVVSATKRDFRPNPKDSRIYVDMIQTDAAINNGNSGGPLLNSYGNVIGVNTFIFSGNSNGFIGLGFAIPSNRVVKIIEHLKTGGKVTLDYDPGMQVTPITRRLVLNYNLPAIQGLLVMNVNKDGPAYECGILPGDIITKIGGARISSETHAWALLRDYASGEIMPIELIRKDQRYETEMVLRSKTLASE